MPSISRLIIVAITLFVFRCEAQVTGSVLNRVLLIQTTSHLQATAFTIDVDRLQYVVTAKHVVAGLGDESPIAIGKFTSSGEVKFVPIPMKIYRCDEPIDIAVLVPAVQLTFSSPLEPTSEGLQYGQDAYFVGFPFGQYSTFRHFPSAYPFGFVKKGVYSGQQYSTGSEAVFLDGINVSGFSGSPVVFRLGNDFHYKVLGVISGFESNLGPVMVRTEINRADIKPEDIEAGLIIEDQGRTYRLHETAEKMYVKLNSGIVKAYAIRYAVDQIKNKHLVGAKTTDDFEVTFAP